MIYCCIFIIISPGIYWTSLVHKEHRRQRQFIH